MRDREKLRREADRRWAKLGHDQPDLAATIAAGRGLVTLYIDHLPPAPALALTPDRAREKLAAGLPLLADESLDVDHQALHQFFVALCDWAIMQPDRAVDGDHLRRAIAGDGFDADDLLAATLADDAAVLEKIAQHLGIGDEFLRSLAGFLVSAALMDAARDLASLLTGEPLVRDSARCPICGGAPLLAEDWGSEGQRALRCAVCGAGWRFARNRCAGCGTEEPVARRYLAAEGQEEKYRVDLCDRCGSYLKSLTTFAPTPAELLVIEDTALLRLEEAARMRGYHPVQHNS